MQHAAVEISTITFFTDVGALLPLFDDIVKTWRYFVWLDKFSCWAECWRSFHHIVSVPTSSRFGKSSLCAHSPPFEHALPHTCTQNTLCGTEVCDSECSSLVISWCAPVKRHVTLWTLTEKMKCSSYSHVVHIHHRLTLVNAQCVFHLRPLPQKWSAHLLPAGAPPAGSSGSGAALRVQERHPGPVPQRKPRPPAEVKINLPHVQEHQARYWNIYRDGALMVWLLQLSVTGYTRLRTQVRPLKLTWTCTLVPKLHRWLPRLM